MFFTSEGFSITAMRFLRRNGLTASARARTDFFDVAFSSISIPYDVWVSPSHRQT